eukprot:10061926-Alexandrium_andersonii.AAC.1
MATTRNGCTERSGRADNNIDNHDHAAHNNGNDRRTSGLTLALAINRAATEGRNMPARIRVAFGSRVM